MQHTIRSFVAAVALAILSCRAAGQNSLPTGQSTAPAPPSAPAASAGGSVSAMPPAGLPSTYGVDLTFDPAWVDGAQPPGQAASSPTSGVNGQFQKMWDTLKPLGVNTLRIPIDVRDAKGSANRVANLCVWAKNNNARLLPILVDADRGQPLSAGYSADVAAFVRGMIAALRAGQNVQVYPQILA